MYTATTSIKCETRGELYDVEVTIFDEPWTRDGRSYIVDKINGKNCLDFFIKKGGELYREVCGLAKVAAKKVEPIWIDAHLKEGKGKMKKSDKIEGFETEGFTVAEVAELNVGDFDILIFDLASLEDDGWQVRESYVSKKDADDYIQVTHGDGHNGWDIASQCGFPDKKHFDGTCQHLGVDPEALEDLMGEVNEIEHLNSSNWDMLETLKEEAKEADRIVRYCCAYGHTEAEADRYIVGDEIGEIGEILYIEEIY